ncbi:MAG: hypothetical protein LBB23_03030 [Rickettsiales bacterium]|jgi:hypothetical protein|nr:hypothetical protein [Rickettsiales bacterium]
MRPLQKFWDEHYDLRAERIKDTIHCYLGFSEQARCEGILALEYALDNNFYDPIIGIGKAATSSVSRLGLQFSIDGAEPEMIASILSGEIKFENVILRLQALGVCGLQNGLNPLILRDCMYEFVRENEKTGKINRRTYEMEIAEYEDLLDKNIAAVERDLAAAQMEIAEYEDLLNKRDLEAAQQLAGCKEKASRYKTRLSNYETGAYKLYYETLLRDTKADLPELHNDDRRGEVMALVEKVR